MGEQVEPGGDDVREQVRGPAAAVEAQQRLAALAADAAQVREQGADLGGEGVRRLGHHYQQRVAGAVGDPGFLGRGAGVLEPGDVHLLHVAGAEVRAGVPIDVEQAEGVRQAGGVAAGDRQLQVRGLAGGGELAELAAQRLDLRRPVQAQGPAEGGGRDPGGALGARLTQQRQEHVRDEHRLQAVEPVLQPAVHLPGRVQQPGSGQRGHREQQPGGRHLRGRGEHRFRALA